MTAALERHHWLNTFVGVLDAAFHLSDEEQFAVTDIVNRLLRQLRIPERGRPETLPIPLAQEVHASLYSLQLEGRRHSRLDPHHRAVNGDDCVASLEAWRAAMVDMLTVAYPDLEVEERLLLSKTTTDLLAAIGVPNRAAAHFPPAVINAHRNLDAM